MARKKKAQPKNPQIILGVIGSEDKQRPFEREHALNLLRLEGTVWEIQDENHIFQNNEIKRRPSETTNSKPEE